MCNSVHASTHAMHTHAYAYAHIFFDIPFVASSLEHVIVISFVWF